MSAGRVRHWKHGWIPISPEAKAYAAGKGPKPITRQGARKISERVADAHLDIAPDTRPFPPSVGPRDEARKGGYTLDDLSREWTGNNDQPNATEFDPLMKAIKDQGGFTYDPKTGGLLEVGKVEGVAVAIPGTEVPLGDGDMSSEAFTRAMSDLIMRNRNRLKNGAVIGGWYSPDRDQYMVEMTEIFPNRDVALAAGKARNQEAVFDLKTGETLATGGTGDAQPLKLPPKKMTAEYGMYGRGAFPVRNLGG